MEKEFIPYELALELKKLSYPQNYYFAWYAHGGLHYDNEYEEDHFVYACCAAPTFSQSFRWFREKYGLHLSINVKDNIWYFERFSIKGFKTYEEAELACLKKLIEIVKTK